MIKTGLAPALAALATLLLATSPARAGTVNRAWVSGHGTDGAGCGAPTTPCRSFQFVISTIIAPGGEIDVLDPAGYGAFSIPFALSIVNDGVGTAGVQRSSGDAVVVNAGTSDGVTIRGLNIDGLGGVGSGIVFNSGARLTVVNCTIRHFAHSTNLNTGIGILILTTQGAKTFLISNATVADNDENGIDFRGTGGSAVNSGLIDRVTASNNGGNGISIVGGRTHVAITNSIADNNMTNGIVADNSAGQAVFVTVDSSIMVGNASAGIALGDTAVVSLGRSTIAANLSEDTFLNDSTPNTFFSWGDNHFNGGGGGNSPTIIAGQ